MPAIVAVLPKPKKMMKGKKMAKKPELDIELEDEEEMSMPEYEDMGEEMDDLDGESDFSMDEEDEESEDSMDVSYGDEEGGMEEDLAMSVKDAFDSGDPKAIASALKEFVSQCCM
jgi:hypothetical protein